MSETNSLPSSENRGEPTAATTELRWTLYGKGPPSLGQWVEWKSYSSEADGLEALSEQRVKYPHYEIELRKRTITEERVDA